MRKVKFKKWIPIQQTTSTDGSSLVKVAGTGCWEKEFSSDGVFHQWGSAIEEHENGIGTYTVAIVELPDGTVEEMLPTNIKFISIFPLEMTL